MQFSNPQLDQHLEHNNYARYTPPTAYRGSPNIKMVPEALPPYRPLSSTPITPHAASALLSTYLTHSETHAHLHPDGLITPTGVTFSSHGGPLGGVIMHNLRRVAAGLRGEYLEVEATPEPEDSQSRGMDGMWQGQGQGQGRKFGKGRNQDRDRKRQDYGTAQGVAATANEGWQNMSEYEREEGVLEVGEVGDRSNFVRSEPIVEDVGLDSQDTVVANDSQATVGAEDEQATVGAKRKVAVDKEARKKAKKDKKKGMRREKEERKKRRD
jgi:hypothetical protein